MIKTDPAVSHGSVGPIAFPWPVPRIAPKDHEGMHGSGYPNEVRATDILQGARILAVADVVETMLSHRPCGLALGRA